MIPGRRGLLTALIASPLLLGCARPMICAPGTGSAITLYTLYFGQSVPGRGPVTDAEWQGFLAASVTPNLPDGYTVWNAGGAWMNPKTLTTISESTKVLAAALPTGDGGTGDGGLAAVNRVRAAYQTTFHQQSVGMTAEPVCGSF